MIGSIFITRSGYDPQVGKHIKDPYLGDQPSLGACRPDVRRRVKTGDQIFTISGRVKGFAQFVMGGFEVAEKIDAFEAFRRFPEQHLHTLEDGQLDGNVIIDGDGRQHPLDTHKGFEGRLRNYVIGKNPIWLSTPDEIARGRQETLEALQDILHKRGSSAKQVVGRFGSTLNEDQVHQLRSWLHSLKVAA